MKEKLKQYMDRTGINQKQLAGLLGVSEGHLSRVLSGKKKAGSKLVEKYMNLPGVQEEEALRSILNYLMLEFSRGNFSREQLDRVTREAEDIIVIEKMNPGD